MIILVQNLLMISLIVLQTSFLKGLGWPWFNINFLLIFSIFLITQSGLRKNFNLIFLGSLLTSILNMNFFIISLINILVVCFCLNLLSLYIFTNKSLFSFLTLGVIGVFFNSLLEIISNYFFYWLNITEKNIIINIDYWYNIIWQGLFAVLFLIIFYLIGGFFSRKQEVYL